jgi:hypothetical protein
MPEYDPETREWRRRAQAREQPFGFRENGVLSIGSASGFVENGVFRPSPSVRSDDRVMWKLVNRSAKRVPPFVVESLCENRYAYFSCHCAPPDRPWQKLVQIGRTLPGDDYYWVQHEGCTLGITEKGLERAVTTFADCPDVVTSEFFCGDGHVRAMMAVQHVSVPVSAALFAPLRVFISYSHADEKMRTRLGEHLAPLVTEGLIDLWHDRLIEAGGNWEGAVQDALSHSDIVLLLVSSSFLNSPNCRGELLRALERRSNAATVVVPIILRPCDWQSTFTSQAYSTQALPRDDRAIASSRWSNQHEAFAHVAKEIRALVIKLRERHVSDPLDPEGPGGPGDPIPL